MGATCSVWVNSVYRGTFVAWAAGELHVDVEVMARDPPTKGLDLLQPRWVVEGMFASLECCQRLSKDYERQCNTAESFARLTMIHLMLWRLAD